MLTALDQNHPRAHGPGSAVGGKAGGARQKGLDAAGRPPGTGTNGEGLTVKPRPIRAALQGAFQISA